MSSKVSKGSQSGLDKAKPRPATKEFDPSLETITEEEADQIEQPVKQNVCFEVLEEKGKTGSFKIALINECKEKGGKSKKRLRRKKRSRKTRKRK
jgi:hypothetical protein